MDEERLNQKLYEEAERFAKWQYETFSKYISGNVIEIGSGDGRIAELLKMDEKVKSVTMSDINGPGIKMDISKKIPNQLRESFDTLVSVNVMEHIEDDVKAIENCRKLLKPGGRIVLLVPGIKAIFGNLDLAQNHYRRFSKYEIKHKMEMSGFVVEKMFSMNFFGIFAWYLQAKLFNMRVIKGANIYDKFVPIMRLVENTVKMPYGLSHIAIGRNDENGMGK